MSRHPTHRRRRCWALWLPLAALGAATYMYATTLTLTANSLNITGLAVMLTGAIAAIAESTES